MVNASTPGLGFNPFSYVKSAATSIYHVAQNPNVQRAAASAAQAYAPEQYAQATQYADQARGLLPPPGAIPVSPGAPGAMVDDGGADEGAAVVHPNVIQKNKWLPFAVIGGGAVVLLLLLKR
jgi:hypothetical protein